MTMASLLGLLVARRMGLRTRITAAAETKSMGIGDVRSVLIGVAKVSLLFEAITAVLLTGRFVIGYDEPLGRAAYLGVWICLPIAFAVIVGGLGFPVVLELRRQLRPRAWSTHAKLTIGMTGLLILLGTLFVTASEWSNPATLGALDTRGRLLAGFFHSVMPRTAGFNSLDVGA
jgi:trk system potassium uptake protein TrkH